MGFRDLLCTIDERAPSAPARTIVSLLRADRDAAFARLKGKMTVITSSADEQLKWTNLFKDVRKRLSQGTFAPELVTKLESLA